ncbi:MAG: PEP-CTERM sorting domain-containing protein [Phycisphaerae bacterium]|nr:PEP-CTERM sorting domain-containing protein [Phycisphaerae bacterium]
MRKSTNILICFGVGLLGVLPIAQANATPLNSNSTVKDGIEYYIQTDKGTYDLGEELNILFRLTNLTDQALDFGFAFGPRRRQCRFIVETEAEVIWDTNWLPVTGALTSFTLDPLETNEFTELGDEPDQGKPTLPGHYEITGSLNYSEGHERYVPVSVQIEIIPESATLALLLAGGLLLTRRRYFPRS